MSDQASPGTPDFETWFRQEGDRILRTAHSLARNPHLAEDIGQEAVIKLVKAWRSEDMRSKILTSPAYVRRVVINTYLDYIKARSRAGRDEVAYDDEVGYSTALHDPAGTTGDHDLRLVIQQLDSDQRDMVLAHYYYGLTIEEAGRQLGYSPSMAYRLHKKALASMEGQLREQEES